jgi:hypothetical protein
VARGWVESRSHRALDSGWKIRVGHVWSISHCFCDKPARSSRQLDPFGPAFGDHHLWLVQHQRNNAPPSSALMRQKVASRDPCVPD